MGEIDWFWDNGTMVGDRSYSVSNTSRCEQMTWPLTYDDGINLLSKDCNSITAYFACLQQCKRLHLSYHTMLFL